MLIQNWRREPAIPCAGCAIPLPRKPCAAWSPPARRGLEFAQCILQHRFRHAIELDDAPQIKIGNLILNWSKIRRLEIK